MPKTIEQRPFFKNATPERLFTIYLSSKEHGKMTGAKASIQNKVGSKFTAHDGWISGKNLQIVPNKLIVQSWRGKDWKKNEVDSTLILKFNKVKNGAEIHMIHANVADSYAKDITSGWKSYYWNPLKKYLNSK